MKLAKWIVALLILAALPALGEAQTYAVRVGASGSTCRIGGGTGTPEAAVTGNVCDLFLRSDGGAGTTIYVKETGAGTDTGWIAYANPALTTHSTTAGITASTTQSQGQQPLTTTVNQVSTVANDGDVVTLPPAAAGLEVVIINDGANTLQIFPASGDNLGAGIDGSVELELNEVEVFVAHDGTNWNVEATTETIHAEMVDNDNTDAFVIVDGGSEQQVYHTNGLAAGDLLGWSFDAGGGGSSFPIASIADSPGSSGSQAEITTTGSHGLAAGDIVSLANMSAGSNAGIHVVLAPIAATTFEIASADSTNATGTMDQAATLIANTGSAGQYLAVWTMSGTAEDNNDVFDFAVYAEATQITSLNQQRKFSVGADVGAIPGVSIIAIADGDHVSFVINNDAASSGDITPRNFALVLVRL